MVSLLGSLQSSPQLCLLWHVSVTLHGRVCVHVKCTVCLLRCGEQSRTQLSVPPDITLLLFGADPAVEVGRPAAPLLWVHWVEVWAGTHAKRSTLNRSRLVRLETVYTMIKTR